MVIRLLTNQMQIKFNIKKKKSKFDLASSSLIRLNLILKKKSKIDLAIFLAFFNSELTRNRIAISTNFDRESLFLLLC